MQKELYFTASTIEAKGREFLDACLEFSSRHAAQVFQSQKAALLVLDMQNYFLDEACHAYVPSARAILPGICSLIEAFQGFGRPVVFTRHANTPADAGMMASWWKELLHPGSAHSAIVPELDPGGGIVIMKSQYDAFLGTGLEQILTAYGVEQVIISGVMTHLCCETTARSAFMRGFEVFFCADGTATYTQAFHTAALLCLSHGFARPVSVSEIVEARNG